MDKPDQSLRVVNEVLATHPDFKQAEQLKVEVERLEPTGPPPTEKRPIERTATPN